MDRLAKAIKLWQAATKAVRPGLVLKPTREKTKGRTVRRWMRASAEEAPSPAQPKAAMMPQDLTTLTRAQTNSAIRTLANLPLKELRRRQDLVSAQLRTASKRRDEKALGNLQVMQDHLTAAVMRREFGGSGPPKGRKAETEPAQKRAGGAPAQPKATEEPPGHATVVQHLADAAEKELVERHEEGTDVFWGYGTPDAWSYRVVYEHANKRLDPELERLVGDELVRRGVLKPDRRHHRQVGRLDDEGYYRVSRGWMNRRLRLGVQKGVLTTEQRKRLKGKTFGLPGEKAYPMPDKAHARNALARAAQQLKAGNLTQEEYERIARKARRILAGKERRPEEIGKGIPMASKSRLVKAIMLWKAVGATGPRHATFVESHHHGGGVHGMVFRPSRPGMAVDPARDKPKISSAVVHATYQGYDPGYQHHVYDVHTASGSTYRTHVKPDRAAKFARMISGNKESGVWRQPGQGAQPPKPSAPAARSGVPLARMGPKRPPGAAASRKAI